MRRRFGAFTLIELMISIAIITIFLSIPFGALQSSRSLTREDDYRWALANARAQKSRLQAIPFEQLPPEHLRVASDGTVKLSQNEIIEGSLTVNGKPHQVDKDQPGRLLVGKQFAGQTVTVDYQFSLPEQNEAHFVDDQSAVQLRNLPLLKVEKAWLVQGDRWTPIVPETVDPQTGRLTFPKLSSGSLVVVDYHGKRWRNLVSSRFLDSSFRPTAQPTGTKLLEVGEEYGGALRMSLPMIKVRPQ